MSSSNTYQSYKTVRKLYNYHCLRYVLGLVFLFLLWGLIFPHWMVYSTASFSLQPFGINVMFLLYLVIGAIAFGLFFRAWKREGISPASFFHHLEKVHPELSNRTTLILYASTHSDEIERLGYSHDLIAAEDQHLIDESSALLQEQRPFRMLIPVASLFLLLLIPSLMLWVVHRDFFEKKLSDIKTALMIHSQSQSAVELRIPEKMYGVRGDPITLVADIASSPESDVAWIHITSPGGWKSFPTRIEESQIQYRLPSLFRTTEYYFSLDHSVSNRGELIPLDPPEIAQAVISVTPPAYTGLQEETIRTLRPFSVPEGGYVHFKMQATAPLVSATLAYGQERHPMQPNEDQLEVIFEVNASDEYSFSMNDIHQLTGQTPRYQLSVVEDATPTVDILSPRPVSYVQDELTQEVQVHVVDDYRIMQILVHTEINDQPDSHQVGRIWQYSPEAADEVGGATEIYLTYSWDLTQFNLFPGDEMTFYLEAWDNDAPNEFKKGRSNTYRLVYPSLTDLLQQLDEQEEEHVRELNRIVDEQSDITEKARETIERISEKIESRPADSDGEDSMWLEKEELNELKERQQELTEEARKIEESLQNYEEQAKETVAQEEEQQQGFTPQTLEKMERIRELMKQVVDEDSQRLIQQIEQAVDQLSQDMESEQLQDLEFSFEDFESQLDRTLSMLEQTFEQRQLDALRETAQELAERQDHLQRETEQLQQKKDELAQAQNQQQQSEQEGDSESSPSAEELQKQADELQKQEQLLAERQERLEQDAEEFLDKMQDLQEEMQEKNPALSEAMKQMQQQLQQQQFQQTLSQASQKLSQKQTQEAMQHQKSAQQMLQQLASQMQQQLANMGSQNMQENSDAIRRLVDRGLFLSHKMESLTESVAGQSQEQYALRLAQLMNAELGRILVAWQKIAQTNPFMKREVQTALQKSSRYLQEGISAGQGVSWVGLHETRQSMIALNAALYQMLQDMQQMQQQMSQPSMQDMQQQMQQMISQQRSLQQMLQELRQMGQEGEQVMQKLQEMAQQQAMIRKQMEEMMKQYRNARQLRNQLQGIFQEMQEVERLLEEGQNNEEVENKQERILSRMLEAGTFQEKDEFGKDREEEVARTGTEENPSPESVQMDWQKQVQQMIQRPDDESVPFQYREAIKKHFVKMSEQLSQ